jgi:hypothetical protein
MASTHPRLLVFTLFACAAGTGCSIKRMAANTTAEILVDGAAAFNEEEDFELAVEAGGANLKALEGFAYAAPDNEDLARLLAQGFGTYTFGILETRAEEAGLDDPDRAEHLRERARGLYARGQRYAERLLRRDARFGAALDGTADALRAALAHAEADDVPALFWCAYNWGSRINLSLHDPGALADLPKVEVLMSRVLELDPGYFHGGAHLFYGVYWAGRPAMLGGNMEKGKESFERAVAVTGGRLLLAKVLYARFYGVGTQDRELFDTLLRQVLDAPDDVFPQERLATEIAKRRARVLMKQAENGEYF